MGERGEAEMVNVKVEGVRMWITGPNDDGEYWLHLSASGHGCGFNLGRPTGMVATALLMAATVSGLKGHPHD